MEETTKTTLDLENEFAGTLVKVISEFSDNNEITKGQLLGCLELVKDYIKSN